MVYKPRFQQQFVTQRDSLGNHIIVYFKALAASPLSLNKILT